MKKAARPSRPSQSCFVPLYRYTRERAGNDFPPDFPPSCTDHNLVNGVDGPGSTRARQGLPGTRSAALFSKDVVPCPLLSTTHVKHHQFSVNRHVHFCYGFGVPLGPTFRDFNSIVHTPVQCTASCTERSRCVRRARRNNEPSSHQGNQPIADGGRSSSLDGGRCCLEAIT